MPNVFISLCYCNGHTKYIVFLPASDKSHAGNGFGVGLPFRIGDRKKKERPISSILDVCGTTRTGTDLRQYNLRFLELHSICQGNCRRERQPSSRSSSNYGSIQTCLSRKVCVYGLQVVSTATYEPVTDRITHRRKKEESGTPERSCIIHEPRSGVVMVSFAP